MSTTLDDILCAPSPHFGCLCSATLVATSANASLELWAQPAHATFAPSQPGVLALLPYRPLYVGETITVSLVANNPVPTGLTGFTIPLMFDSNYLQLSGAHTASLWLPPPSVPTRSVSGSRMVVTLSSTARAAGAQNNL
jgi:hypothetical protein